MGNLPARLQGGIDRRKGFQPVATPIGVHGHRANLFRRRTAVAQLAEPATDRCLLVERRLAIDHLVTLGGLWVLLGILNQFPVLHDRTSRWQGHIASFRTGVIGVDHAKTIALGAAGIQLLRRQNLIQIQQFTRIKLLDQYPCL